MSIKISAIQDGLEVVEVFTPPTLKEMCLFKCFSNKDILTKEFDEDEDEAEPGPRSSNLSSWKKYRLKETINGVLVEDLLDFGDEFMFMLTPKYVPVLAAIRMSQPENLVKVHVTNTRTLMDNELEWLMSGGNVKSLDIHGCQALQKGSLETINKYGGKLEYLRIGNSSQQVLPEPYVWDWKSPNSTILRTPNLKTFIVGGIEGRGHVTTLDKYWKFLLHDFITTLEDLRINYSEFLNLDFLLPAKDTLSALTVYACIFIQHGYFCHVINQYPLVWSAESPIFKLKNLKFLDLKYQPYKLESIARPAQRAMTALPKLTALNIYRTSTPGEPPEVVDIGDLETPPSRRRLKFLGTTVGELELNIAKRFAKNVAGFESSEGDMCALEFYASRSYDLFSPNTNTVPHLEWFMRSHELSQRTATVISLVLKSLKHNGFIDGWEDFIPTPPTVTEELRLLNNLLTKEVASKLGSFRVTQIVDCVAAKMMKVPDGFNLAAETELMRKLEAELHLDHYITVVTPILEAAIKMIKLLEAGVPSNCSRFSRSMESVAQLFRTAVDRFPETFATPSEIQLIFRLIRKLSDSIRWSDVFMRSFCSILSSLQKLCLTCDPFKTMFQAADGNGVILELLFVIDAIRSESLPDVHCLTLPLLEILEVLLQDSTFLELNHEVIASKLERLLRSNTSKWGAAKNPVVKWSISVTMESIFTLLHFHSSLLTRSQ